ncbi:MAG: DJ-1/PfpI family protein [Desulfobacterales bacterium]
MSRAAAAHNSGCHQGRKITGWTSIIQDIKNAGAKFVDSEVVEDGNIISSRNPNDLPALFAASLKIEMIF